MNALFRAGAVLMAALFGAGGGHAAESLCGTLADAFAAEAAGLAREWIVQVPFDSSAWRLEQVVVDDGLVVAQSGDGGVTAIAATAQGRPPVLPGTVLWSQRSGRPGRTIVPAAVGPAIIAVGDDLHMLGLDRMSGQRLWQETISFPLAVGAAASGDWFYAPLDGNGVLRLAANPLQPQVVVNVEPTAGKKKKKGRQPERRVSETVEPRSIDGGGIIGLPPVRYGTGVTWCTSTGQLVVLVRADTDWRREEFDLLAPPAVPLLVRDGMIFAATTAGEVAAVELTDFGLRTKWRMRLGDAPVARAMFAGQMLLVPLAAGGAVGIDAATGSLQWRSDTIRTFLAADARRIWCIDAMDRLSLIDPSNGERQAWFCLGPFTFPVTNTSSDRLVLASPKGTLVSLVSRPSPPVTAKDAPAPAPADPAATPPAADRRAVDPSE